MKQMPLLTLLITVLSGCIATTPDKPYCFVIIPDTQNYSRSEANHVHFEAMTQWIVEQREKLNIVLVLHEGDLVEHNSITNLSDRFIAGREGADQVGLQMWASAKRAISVLDGELPYILCTGNHDYGFRNAEDRQTHFNTFFASTDNPLNSDGQGGGILRGMGTNAYGARTLENAYYEMQGPDGRDFLIIALEWAPREAAVQWAKQIANLPEFAEHTAILLTHSYLSHDDNYDASAHTYPTALDTHGGQELWDELVGPSENIQITLNGHVGGDQVGYRVDTNAGGKDVHQILFNAQFDGGGRLGNGGDGWLRIMSFEPHGSTVSVRTYSPLREAWGKSAWRTDEANQFSFEISP